MSEGVVLARQAFQRRPVQIAGSGDASWGIAVEAPVEIAINGVPWTVMLATPADVQDLAIGIALSERVITDANAIEQVVVSEFLEDLSVNLVVPAAAIDQEAQRARSLLGSTACGLCGLESLAALRPRMTRADDGVEGSARVIDDAAVLRAFAALPALQPINHATRSVHAAAWCTPDGNIALVREDVGRHNALDKVIGALAQSRRLGESGFVVMSSRCSYELVYKAAAAHALLLATISAPTSLALEWSRELDVPLAALGPAGALVRFPVLAEQDHAH